LLVDLDTFLLAEPMVSRYAIYMLSSL